MSGKSTNNIEQTLLNGNIELKGEFMWGSNYTFLAEITHQGQSFAAVYKPIRGERPLWDFPPSSLAKREVAAFLVSEAIGWRFVPPTVFRMDGPLGPGSIQLFIEHDPEYHYFNFNKEDQNLLQPVALFDILINNADRKGSHILFDQHKKLWLIDHGVCFHVQDKLRTVVWDFAGEEIPENLLTDVIRFQEKLLSNVSGKISLEVSLGDYLNKSEINEISNRARNLIEQRYFPIPDPNRRHFPWPQI